MGVLAGLLPVAFGAVVLFAPTARRNLGLDRGASVTVSVLCVSIGVAGAVGLVAGAERLLPRAALPAVLLPLGAVVGAAAVLIRGVSLRSAAVYLDRRGGLRERLATAVELAGSEARDSAVAQTVYAQALAACRRRRADIIPMWRRSRATPAGLGLIVLLCIVLGFVPSGGHDSEGRRLAAAIRSASLAERLAAAESLRGAARQVSGRPELADRLVKAAHAIEVRDEEQLRKILDQLDREGFQIASAIPPKLVAAARTATAAGENASGAARAPAGGGTTDPGPAGLVRVYSPPRADSSAAGAANGDSGATDSSAAEQTIPYADAWTVARERAAARIARGQVPPRYHRLVRDFFQAK